jgi:hypothetical protein
MKVGFTFCCSDSKLWPRREYWGLLDSGASVTAIPRTWIGLYEKQFPKELTGPVTASMTGVHAERKVLGYFAILDVGGHVLNGPFCPSCGVRRIERRCPECLKEQPLGAFLIATIGEPGFAIIGRDVTENFVTAINPLACVNSEKFSMLADRSFGGLLAWSVKALRGTSLSP